MIFQFFAFILVILSIILITIRQTGYMGNEVAKRKFWPQKSGRQVREKRKLTDKLYGEASCIEDEQDEDTGF